MGATGKRVEREYALRELRGKLDGSVRAVGGRRRITSELWEASARAAERYGVREVSKELGLNQARLRAHVEDLARGKGGEQRPAAFIEVVGGAAKPEAMSSIELEKASGSKIRIEFEGGLSAEVSRLSERLWRASR